MMREFSALSGRQYDVAVVGLGPVGITLCNLLAQHGVDVVGLDTRPGIYALPRAIGMDHEVMRVFQNIGIADDLATAVDAYHDSIYRAVDGTILRRFVSPPEPHRLGWPAYLTFVQPELEKSLRDKALSRAGIELHPGVEVVHLDDPSLPRLTVRDFASGDETSLEARFVVGCDGGGSFIRRSLGLTFEDLVFDQPWLVVDVLVGDAPPALPATNVQYCDPSRPHTFVRGPGRLRRWEFMMLPGETAEAINRPERIWQLLAPWIAPGQAEIWRSATYRFHALVAERWRVGNVFLAGDACHMTPPFLAQGMVQGIKDAANLAWKLAAVLKGRPERILATYQDERRPLVRQVIAITKDLGHVICEIDPERARRRDDELKALMARGEGTRVRQDLFPPITDGIVARNAAGEPGPGAGRPCPQPWLRSGPRRVRLDDLLGQDFALVTCDLALGERTRERVKILEIAVCEIGTDAATWSEEDGVLADWLRTFGACAVLARPDRVVFGVAGSEAEIEGLLDQVEAWLGDPDGADASMHPARASHTHPAPRPRREGGGLQPRQIGETRFP